jgi:hypothetical protein
MAETFKVGANARELLRYTQRATRIVSRSDARKIIQKVAALEDVRDIQKVCGTAVHALDTRDREGFSKSTFRLYGEGIRLTARQILLDAHAANNVNFQTDYDKRVEKIGGRLLSAAGIPDHLHGGRYHQREESRYLDKEGHGRKIPGDEVAHVGTRTCRKTPGRSGTETADRTGCRPESCPLPGTVNAQRATALHKGCGLFV